MEDSDNQWLSVESGYIDNNYDKEDGEEEDSMSAVIPTESFHLPMLKDLSIHYWKLRG